MTGEASARTLFFDFPAKYRISVRGSINQNWSDRLEGMTIMPGVDEDGQVVCTLEGELLDQSALVGVIVTLYEMHLPLLLVRCLDCRPACDRE